MTRDRLWPLIAAAVAAVLLMTAAALFTNASVATRITDNAEKLHWANATLGTAALTRAAAGQVALLQEIGAAGGARSDALAIALEELDSTRGSLQRLAADSPVAVEATLDEFLDRSAERPVALDRLDDSYWPLAGWLESVQNQARRSIADNDNSASRLSALMRLLVTLVFPGAAIWFYRKRVRAAEEKMRAERELIRAKDEVVTGMSHELRTPLTAIYGFSQVLLDSPPSVEADRHVVGIINSEAWELTRMVDDLIVAARLEDAGLAIEPVPTDLYELARSVIAPLERRGIDVTVEGSGIALADPGRTSHILKNLLSNAEHHGGDSVAVVISEAGEVVRCAVHDDGDGVPDQVVDRLFSRFVHGSGDMVVAGSLGMGSWVARDLARLMGGDVVYERQEDRTAFVLTLPRPAHVDYPPRPRRVTVTP